VLARAPASGLHYASQAAANENRARLGDFTTNELGDSRYLSVTRARPGADDCDERPLLGHSIDLKELDEEKQATPRTALQRRPVLFR
jgi:hypothetical protein